MNAEWAVYNGDLCRRDEFRLPPGSRSFLYGEGLFETIRVDAGGPVQACAHLARLRQGARVLGFPTLPGAGELLAGLEQVAAANELVDGALRLTVAQEASGRGLLPPGDGRLHWLVTAAPFPYREEQYVNGFRGVILPYPHPAGSYAGHQIHHLKHTSALPLVLGKRFAAAAGADEGIYLNRRGHLTEGTVSNLFWLSGGIVYTPPASAGLLSGVARRTVLWLAGRRSGLRIRPGVAGVEALATADEAFLTNSLLEVMPLVSVDGCPIGQGRPGPITWEILEYYRELRRRRTGPFAERKRSP